MRSAEQTFALAVEHHRGGRFRAAEENYRRVLELDPGNHSALAHLAMIALEESRNDVAADYLRRAVAVAPSIADYHLNLGAAYRRMGRFEDAAACFTNVVNLQPEYPQAHFNLGVVLDLLGSPLASAAFERAAALAPGDLAIQRGVAAALMRRDELLRSLVHWERAVSLDPSVKSLVELGTNHRLLGDYPTAVAVLRRVLAVEPRHVSALVELAAALMEQGGLDEAEDALRLALSVSPASVPALFNLASALMLLGRATESAGVLRRLLTIDPTQAKARSNLLVLLNYDPSAGARDVLREAEEWGRRHAPPPDPPPVSASREPDATRKLRVGYFSNDFNSLLPFMPPLFEHHDSDRFEVLFYSNAALPESLAVVAARRRHGVREVGTFDDAALVRLIREDRLDVLVDLAMHMDGNRLQALAAKPAPVQIAWLAYPGTTGVPAFDFRLTDPHLDPRDAAEHLYTEQSLWLPHSFWPYAPRHADVEPGPLPARTAGFVTFGSLNAFTKINAAVLDLWARVLARVPGSRLLVLAPSGRARDSARVRLARDGIDAARIEFVDRKPEREYLETYRRLDVCLDTFPANGHTTSLDAFWMGVPVVTLAGARAVTRGGLSIAQNLGMPELVARTTDDYVDIAARLAADLDGLEALRRTLRATMAASPLEDGPGFVANLEQAYRGAVKRAAR